LAHCSGRPGGGRPSEAHLVPHPAPKINTQVRHFSPAHRRIRSLIKPRHRRACSELNVARTEEPVRSHRTGGRRGCRRLRHPRTMRLPTQRQS